MAIAAKIPQATCLTLKPNIIRTPFLTLGAHSNMKITFYNAKRNSPKGVPVDKMSIT
jgi:hypothetical protein